MAKEFKQWDKAFSKDQIDSARVIWLRSTELGYRAAINEDGWFEEALEHMGYTAVGIQEARYAVYEADGFKEWQLFRVAMKGLTTEEKVFMCRMRWEHMVDNAAEDEDISESEIVTEKHRIWNYLGALKRGGQLVEDEFGNLIINK